MQSLVVSARQQREKTIYTLRSDWVLFLGQGKKVINFWRIFV
jgi:hypothetical protein